MWQGIGVACLMSTHCKSQRGCLTFLVGTILGMTIGCTLTLTYSLQLNKVERSDFYRLPRMSLDATKMFYANIPTEESVTVKQHEINTELPFMKQPENANNIKVNNEDNDVGKPQQQPTQGIGGKVDYLLASVHKMKILNTIDNPHSTYRKPYLVAVMATNSPTSKIETIYDTWGRDVPDIKFFTGITEASQQLKHEGVPIVSLKKLSLSTSKLSHILAILEYIQEHLLNEFNWFVLASDEVYINGHGLDELLSHMNPESNTYLGHPVPLSEPYMNEKSSLYCMGQLSIVLSRSSLENSMSKFDQCHDLGKYWDQQFGQCIRRTLGIECATDMKEAAQYFILDANGHTESVDYLLEDSTFLKALTLAPIFTDEHMYTLHYFYKFKQLNSVQEKASELNDQLKQICQNLPQNVLESEKIQDYCVDLNPQNVKDEDFDLDTGTQGQSMTTPFSKFRPRNRFQVQAWNYFDAINIYEDESIIPRRPLKTYKYHSMELQKALQEAVKAASRQHHAKLRFKKIINGYVRHNPLLGNEYIIDAKFVEARNPRKKLEKRMRLLRPLASSYIVQPSKSNTSETVHFVVPITKVTNRFGDFLRMYEKLALIPGGNTHLVLAVYGDDDVRQISQNVSIYYKKYPKAEIKIVQGYGEFSRAKALDLGMSKLQDTDLAFLCDVDMDIDQHFLTKCRRNTAQGQSVYYPEVFKLYNRKYVYRNGWHPRKYSISREQGHWGYYAYGMLCIYKSDYKAIGGLDVAMVGWGGEDVDLYERVLHNGLDVLRSPDTSLVHRWHSKSCKMQSSSKMLEHCLMSQSEVLADRRELARYIFDNQGLDEGGDRA